MSERLRAWRPSPASSGATTNARRSPPDSPTTAAERFGATGPDAIPVPNVLGTLMHHPALAGPFLAYNDVLLRAPALDPRLRELMILRVAWRTGSPYEWAQHVRLADRVGITPDEIEAVADGADAARWSPLEADLLAATDELHRRLPHRRRDVASTRRRSSTKRQLVELVFVVGTYTGLAMAFNSFGLELDADLPAAATTSRPDFEE